MASGYFKDLIGRTASDEILRDKAFNAAKNTMNIKGVLLQCLINFLIKIPLSLHINLLPYFLKMKKCQTKN